MGTAWVASSAVHVSLVRGDGETTGELRESWGEVLPGDAADDPLGVGYASGRVAHLVDDVLGLEPQWAGLLVLAVGTGVVLRRRPAHAALLGVPAVVLLALGALGIYPPYGRLALVAVVGLLVLVAALPMLADAPAGRDRRPGGGPVRGTGRATAAGDAGGLRGRPAVRAVRVGLLVLLAAVTAVPTSVAVGRVVDPEPREGGRPLVEELAQRLGPDDVVVVDYWAEPSTLWYADVLPGGDAVAAQTVARLEITPLEVRPPTAVPRPRRVRPAAGRTGGVGAGDVHPARVAGPALRGGARRAGTARRGRGRRALGGRRRAGPRRPRPDGHRGAGAGARQAPLRRARRPARRPRPPVG